jgi:hypothetical protein
MPSVRVFRPRSAFGHRDELILRIPLEGAGAVAGEIAIRVNGSTCVRCLIETSSDEVQPRRVVRTGF